MLDKNDILKRITENLELTDSQFKNIKQSYESVAEWLNASDEIKKYGKAEIFPQGSVALGTVVKPLKKEEYDIDLVFHINNSNINPATLKRMVGNRLKENETYKKMLDDEGKRCWTLKYSDSLRYHMDILPTKNETRPVDYCGIKSISATNWNKTTGIYTEKSTNPKGYIKWFLDKSHNRINESLSSINKIDEYSFKTILQKTVQLLKRHRDIYFHSINVDDDIPLSIIITTLAAQSYTGEIDIANSLSKISANLEKNIRIINNKIFIRNPVDNRENFAEKWNENNEKYNKFFIWLRELKNDTLKLQNLDGLDLISHMCKMFGESAVNSALDDIGEELYEARENGNLSFNNKSSRLYFGKDNIVENHTFYGV